jgi:hypothetical protein
MTSTACRQKVLTYLMADTYCRHDAQVRSNTIAGCAVTCLVVCMLCALQIEELHRGHCMVRSMSHWYATHSRQYCRVEQGQTRVQALDDRCELTMIRECVQLRKMGLKARIRRACRCWTSIFTAQCI